MSGACVDCVNACRYTQLGIMPCALTINDAGPASIVSCRTMEWQAVLALCAVQIRSRREGRTSLHGAPKRKAGRALFARGDDERGRFSSCFVPPSALFGPGLCMDVL